jgi:hypothetical protein
VKVNIEFGAELEPVVQQHLETGVSVQNYVRAAVAFFNVMRTCEAAGRRVGHGDANRFKLYNTEVSPAACLQDVMDIRHE